MSNIFYKIKMALMASHLILTETLHNGLDSFERLIVTHFKLLERGCFVQFRRLPFDCYNDQLAQSAVLTQPNGDEPC